MFQRRVLVLAIFVVFVISLLLMQLIRLAVFEGDRHEAVAQSRLQVETLLPTWRGSIFDRRGRLLAEDQPAYDVAVSYDIITGAWTEREAAKSARAEMGRQRWNMLGPEEREAAIGRHRSPFAEVVDGIWVTLAVTAGCSVEELEVEGNRIKGQVQHMAAVVWERQRQRHEDRFEKAVDRPDFRRSPIAEQEAFHVVLSDITDTQAVGAQRLADAHPQLVQVRYARTRAKPHATREVVLDRTTFPRGLRAGPPLSMEVRQVGSQLIGNVRHGVWEEDMRRRPFRDPATGQVDRGGYLLDDEVGTHGVERAREDWLRGTRGSITRRRDHDEETRLEAVPGRDIQSTIDIALQARVEAILSNAAGLLNVQPWHGDSGLATGRPLNGAVVVLDIETGEVLAMASAPNRGQVNDMSPVERQVRTPWVDRGVEAMYPPGSIVKPMVLAAAMSEGVHASDSTITCRGHHYPNRRDIARCWIYRQQFNLETHGPLMANEALARSCNCFFYELGSSLGLERIVDWMEYFGAGRHLDTGLSAPGGKRVESPGSLPDAETISRLASTGEADFEAVMLAIGQGRFAWTPLHAANAFAILARHGQRLPPTLVRGMPTTSLEPDRVLDPRAVDTVLAGLKEAVTAAHGTGSRIRYGPGDYEPIFDVGPVEVWGKTGTAQAPPMPSDLDGDGVLADDERLEGLHHAWFAGLAGATEPEFAIAVLVEHGGSGGRVAGPVANQLIHALIAEGYLPPLQEEYSLQ